MSTITEIQAAIGRLPAHEKSALAAWLQSQEEPLMSEAEAAALLASLNEAAVKRGLEEKAAEFIEKGSEVYAKT